MDWDDLRVFLAVARDESLSAAGRRLKIDAATGSQTPLFDPARMEAAQIKLPGVSGDEARRLSPSRALTFNPA